MPTVAPLDLAGHCIAAVFLDDVPHFALADGVVHRLDHGHKNVAVHDGLLCAAMASPGPLVMATKVTGDKGGAWIQSGAAYGDPEEVWVSDANGHRRIEMPADLVNPPPTPFPVTDLIQTEQDRWHTSGFDVPPYARLFSEMKARIEGREPTALERAGTFRDAAAGQAVLDAVRRSAAERQWVKVEEI